MTTFYIIVALAVIGAAMQLLDLHTTSEILKRGKGREANGLLGFMNDGRADDDPRFWKLVALKFVMAAAVVGAGVVAYRHPEAWYLPPMMAALDCWYAWVLWNNWQLFRKL